MKSEHYNHASVQAVLDRLDGQTFLKEVGLSNGDFQNEDGQIKCYCPICHDRSKMSLVIDCETRRGHCTNLSCQGSNLNTEEGNLIELYALATEANLDKAIEDLAKALSVQLEELKANSKIRESRIEDFVFVEVGHYTPSAEEDQPSVPAAISFDGKQAEGRGILIEVDKLEEFATKYRTDAFRSHFLFNTDDKPKLDGLAEQGKLPLLGDFYVVFDASSSAEIVHAINQAIDLVERMKQNYDVPYDAVSVFYTNTNIEVHIDYPIFGIQPTANLHEIYRRMVCAIIGVDPLKPQHSSAFSQINLNSYRHDYMANIPATLVSTGTREIYKIRMSFNAFKKMSYQRLHEFSLRRPDLPPRERWNMPSPKAVEFFNSVRSSLERDTQLDERDTIASLFYRVSHVEGGIATLKQIAPTLLRRLFDETRQVLASPSKHLNEVLAGGLYPGQMYVIAGFPGAGTSSLALQMLNNIAANERTQCFFIGLQRGVEEVFKRSLSYLGKIAVSEIDEKRHNPQDLYDDKDFNRRIFAAYERYQQFADSITILEGAAAGSLSLITQLILDKREEIRARGSKSASVLLVIDSLQLMVAMMRASWTERMLEGETSAIKELARWDVETLTSRLKALARELDITVLATHELYTTVQALSTDTVVNDPVLQRLYIDTQFADAVMVLSRQKDSLLNLRDFFKSQYTGTPLESKIDPINKRLTEIEKDYQQTQQFQALRSEFTILDIIKNRSGPREKILFAYHKPISYFEPLDYLEEV